MITLGRLLNGCVCAYVCVYEGRLLFKEVVDCTKEYYKKNSMAPINDGVIIYEYNSVKIVINMYGVVVGVLLKRKAVKQSREIYI